VHGLAVHGLGRSGGRRLNEAEHLAPADLDPVPPVPDFVLALYLQGRRGRVAVGYAAVE
jgi:hypothetical protein